MIKTNFFHLNENSNPRSMNLLINCAKGLCFSRMFLLSRMETSTGTSVRVVIKAPDNAKPRVKASGENIFPSTFWKAKIGIRPVIIMTFEKNMALPILVPTVL